MKKLTNKQIKMFWMFVDTAVRDLKLTDWSIHKLVDDDQEADTLATCAPQWKFKKATIRLNPMWDVPPSPETIAQTAVHEVLHILMNGVMHAGEVRWMTEAEHDQEEHEVIRRLLPVLTGAEEKG